MLDLRKYQITVSQWEIHHDDVIKWKHFLRYWTVVRGIHRSPVSSSHKGQWRGALKFSLVSARINGWVNNREAGDLRRHRAHYDIIVMHKEEDMNVMISQRRIRKLKHVLKMKYLPYKRFNQPNHLPGWIRLLSRTKPAKGVPHRRSSMSLASVYTPVLSVLP